MNRYFLLFTVLLLGLGYARAQHDSNWFFGRWAGLRFGSGSPEAFSGNALSTLEGTAVMSDMEGRLMFYTNGATVYNKNNQIMANGTGLAGHHSSSQSSIIIPKPQNSGYFYVFTIDAEGGAKGLSYSEVDMAQAGGLGAVTVKNIPLVAPVCEKLVASVHANGTDIWVTVHHWGSDAFHSYLVTAAGVSAIPVVSHSGTIAAGTNNSAKYAGWMAMSPLGNRLAVAHKYLAVEVLDFDNATGTLGNPVVLKSGMDAEAYGIEFSPDGKLLYVTNKRNLLQYNTSVANIAATEKVISAIDNDGAIKAAPDGKLYLATKAIVPFLSVIQNPNIEGPGCNYSFNAIDLQGKNAFLGLPNFLTSPFYITAINATADCTGNTISFSAITTHPAHQVTWDFGDGTTSAAAAPTHTYTSPGSYRVVVKATRGYFVRYFTQSVTVANVQAVTAHQPQNLYACEHTQSGKANFTLSGQDLQVLGSQPAAAYAVTYHASQQEADAGSNPLPSAYQNDSSPQTIYARVTAIATGCFAVTSFTLNVLAKPVIAMPAGYTLCGQQAVTVTAPAGFTSYTWSNGTVGRSATLGEGNYMLTVGTDYGNGNICTADFPVTVRESSKAVIRQIITGDWTDHSNTITVVADGPGDYRYSIDGQHYQASPVFTGLEPGVYMIYVDDAAGCGLATKQVALLMYPKYFTPNGDSVHDSWQVKFARWEPALHVHIFDRYGKVVASFGGASAGWDGKFDGRDLPSTDYWFTVTRQDGTVHKGHFAMLR